MTFNVRGFLRQLPAELIKTYFVARNIEVPAKWWSEEGLRLAKRLSEYLLTSNDRACEHALAELARAYEMASERGRTALINAAGHREDITGTFGNLANDADRSIWMLISHSELFREAEELLFFDHYSERKQGRHYVTDCDLQVSRSSGDIAKFRDGLCRFYRARDGSGISCEVEFIERHQRNGLQATIYVQV